MICGMYKATSALAQGHKYPILSAVEARQTQYWALYNVRYLSSHMVMITSDAAAEVTPKRAP